MSSPYSFSFYIPLLSVDYTDHHIAWTFDNHCIGTVTRVDFVPLVQDKPNMHSAFVHCQDANQTIVKCIEEKQSFRLPLSGNKYWILLKNKNPVAETRLNIHQVVENARLLEIQVAEQNEWLEKQMEQIQRLQETLFQVIGKVYDRTNEFSQIYNHYNYMMYGKHCKTRWIMSEVDYDETKEEQM